MLTYKDSKNITHTYETDVLNTIHLRDMDVNDIISIGDTPNLKILNLSQNELTNFDFVKDIDFSLDKLFLDDNKIDNIPDSNVMIKLVSLKELSIHHNKIKELKNIDMLVNLQYFYASCNKISYITNLDKLSQLIVLDLANNKLTKIPKLRNSTKLKELCLSDNKISKLENLETLECLECLDVAYNKIQKIENLEKLQKLKSLEIFYNEITKLENISELTELEKLNICENDITILDPTIEKCTNLKYIFIDVIGKDFHINPVTVTELIATFEKLIN